MTRGGLHVFTYQEFELRVGWLFSRVFHMWHFAKKLFLQSVTCETLYCSAIICRRPISKQLSQLASTIFSNPQIRYVFVLFHLIVGLVKLFEHQSLFQIGRGEWSGWQLQQNFTIHISLNSLPLENISYMGCFLSIWSLSLREQILKFIQLLLLEISRLNICAALLTFVEWRQQTASIPSVLPWRAPKNRSKCSLEIGSKAKEQSRLMFCRF